MDDIIIYRPYRYHGWFLPLTIFVGILAFVAVGFCIPDTGYIVLFFATLGTISICLTKVCYDSSNIVIFFEHEGLRITGGRYNNYRFLAWEGFSYAYYVRSYKGHLFLVLSPKVLSPKEAKSFANRGANSSRICVDFVAVIPIDFMKSRAHLQELMDNKGLYVDTY